jgi:hypothetical protein
VASHNFMSAWKSKKQVWVAQDEPQVSVGGLLDRQSLEQFLQFWYIFEEKS